MGLTLTLTDAEIPASPPFIEFLYAYLNGEDYHVGLWHAQQDETLSRRDGRFKNIQEKASNVIANKEGKRHVVRSYRYFKEMLTGKPNLIKQLEKFKFYFVVGIPRTGGTYLTKQMFLAANIDYKTVQNALAHDGFPHLAPLSFKGRGNIHTNGLLQLAEFLTMVEIYYGGGNLLRHNNKIVVPKKFTKAVYNYPLIREMFSGNSNFLITLRHPISMTQSVIEKSGGMPKNRRYDLRSAIERWALDSWLQTGKTEDDVRKMGYVDVMVGYWKRYHYHLALSGMAGSPNTTLVPYGEKSMTDITKKLFADFGVYLEPEKFKVAEPPKFEKSEELLADMTVAEMAVFWESLGLKFPKHDLMQKF